MFLVLNGDDNGSSGSSSSSASGPSDERLVTVFSAVDDIAPNTFGSAIIEQGLLETRQVKASEQPAGAITSAAVLQDRIVVTPIKKDQIITESNLLERSLSKIPVPEGFEAAAVSVGFVNGGAGYIAPGDRINIYGQFGDIGSRTAGASEAEGGNLFPRTELLFTNVLVLDVSRQASSTAAQTSQSGTNTVARSTAAGEITYLLAVRTADAERLFQVDSFANAIRVTLTADDAPPTGDTGGSDGLSVLDPVSAASADPNG